MNTKNRQSGITAIIPSRYGSSRFEGKPLASVAGKPMIQRVYEQALKSEKIETVIVATDDDRIFRAVEKFGGKAILTESTLRSGTDRVAQATTLLGLAPDDIVVNIQGDQPLFNPACIDEMLAPFVTEPMVMMSTLAFKIINLCEITDPKDVKVVLDKDGYALYFSRSRIPFLRDGGTLDGEISEGETRVNYYKHLGFYAYRKSFLDRIATLPEGTLENIEKLEQLRVLEYGYRIKVVITSHDSLEVDIPEDIVKIENSLLKKSVES
ncbi:MAG: 3-deoxy-manno-octulosonate cytidylyltransferase [Desulfamplus sp.]|nr:3-deoxy-manno-octulosonate cytidylyltransferase [Desulfamplus sp.]